MEHMNSVVSKQPGTLYWKTGPHHCQLQISSQKTEVKIILIQKALLVNSLFQLNISLIISKHIFLFLSLLISQNKSICVLK